MDGLFYSGYNFLIEYIFLLLLTPKAINIRALVTFSTVKNMKTVRNVYRKSVFHFGQSYVINYIFFIT